MNVYPLFFNHGGLVAGRGFLAHVRIQGRCLLEETDEEFVSFFGVNPGGVAGQGSTQDEARRDFLEHLRLVVFDFASEALSFEHFKELVEAFVAETNRPSEAQWLEAVAAVRAGEVDRSGYSRTLPAEQPPAAIVVRVRESSPAAIAPDMNQQDDMRVAACG